MSPGTARSPTVSRLFGRTGMPRCPSTKQTRPPGCEGIYCRDLLTFVRPARRVHADSDARAEVSARAIWRRIPTLPTLAPTKWDSATAAAESARTKRFAIGAA